MKFILYHTLIRISVDRFNIHLTYLRYCSIRLFSVVSKVCFKSLGPSTLSAINRASCDVSSFLPYTRMLCRGLWAALRQDLWVFYWICFIMLRFIIWWLVEFKADCGRFINFRTNFRIEKTSSNWWWVGWIVDLSPLLVW